MKRRNFRIEKEPLLMIVPMIDIMFFLLVFFMVSTVYMVQLHTIPVNLPKASSAVRQEKPNLISITVMDDGAVLYEKDTIPILEMKERIQNSLQGDPEVIFVLRGDKKATYDTVVAALDVLKNAGAHKISIATEMKVR